MSICASGASTTKPGVPSSVVVDSQYAQTQLPPALAFLYPYLPWMHGLEIGDVGAFCALDPPIPGPLPSVTDFLGFITGNISSALAVNNYLQELTKLYLWHQLCECTSGATPAPPAPPADPGNLPQVNPPTVVTLPAPTPCEPFWYGSTGITLPNDGTSHNVVSAGKPINGVTAIQVKVSNVAFGATHGIWQVTNKIVRYDFSTAVNELYNMASGQTRVFNYPWLAEYATFEGFYQAVTIGVTDKLNFLVDGYCGSVLPSTSQPCCPPDPVLTAKLAQLLDMVTLIQRQAVPFAYVPGNVHAGLTGDGTITVSGLIGCKVDMTTIPSSYGVAAGSPEEHFDLGFVTFGTPDGYPSSKRLEHQPTLFLPARCSAYTELAYTLAPGVVATITELLREP